MKLQPFTREPLEHATACESARRPRAAVFRAHGRPGWVGAL